MMDKAKKTLASLLASGLIALNACASVPNYKCPNLANKVTTEKTQEATAPQQYRSTQDSYWDSKEQRLTLYDFPVVDWQWYVIEKDGEIEYNFFIPESAVDYVIENDASPKNGEYTANDFPVEEYDIKVIDRNKDRRPEEVIIKMPEEDEKYLLQRFYEESSINIELDKKASDEK